jgi:hypothetical protein
MCTPACHNAGSPVSLEFEKQGSFEDVDGLDVYVTGTGKQGVIFVVDIFGFEFQQVCSFHSINEPKMIQKHLVDFHRGKLWLYQVESWHLSYRVSSAHQARGHLMISCTCLAFNALKHPLLCAPLRCMYVPCLVLFGSLDSLPSPRTFFPCILKSREDSMHYMT